MNDKNKTCDLFIAHSPSDSPLAAELAETFRTNGLMPFLDRMVQPGESLEIAIWEALAESRALVVLLSPAGTTPWMEIELGAAWMWKKPVFGILTEPSTSRIPLGLARSQLYPLGRIDDVIRAIKLVGQELSAGECTLLARIYSDSGVPVDELALDTDQLHEMATRFTHATGKAIADERLLSELLRLGKQGKLRRNRAAERSSSRKGQRSKRATPA